MKFLRQLTTIFLTCSVVVFPVIAEEMDHSTMDHSTMDHSQMEVQQHGTTMMHTSPSDEDDMSHTMHKSPASKAVTKELTHGTSDHHAEHDMDKMQHDKAEHVQHEKKTTKNMASAKSMEKLKQLPPSGKSREANYDGTYFMHNTSLEQSLEAKCALASRGIMMLDNESWKKCGGKPIGWSKGITSAQSDNEHSQHMNH